MAANKKKKLFGLVSLLILSDEEDTQKKEIEKSGFVNGFKGGKRGEHSINCSTNSALRMKLHTEIL